MYWFRDFIVGYLDHMEPIELIIMASKDPQMSMQGAAGRRKHLTSTILQKLEIIRGLEKWQKLERGYCFIQHWIVSCLDIKRRKDQS
jgi:hypothetical protein